MEKSQKSDLAYKQLSNGTFFAYTLFLYLMIVLLAILIPDVSKIFDSTSAIGASCLCFLFPGGFFIGTYSLLAKEKYRRKFEMKVYYYLSIVMFILGLGMMSEALYISINGMVNTQEAGK